MNQINNNLFSPQIPNKIIINNLNQNNINYNINNNYPNIIKNRRNSKSENISNNTTNQIRINNNNPNQDPNCVQKSIDQIVSKFSKSQQSMISDVVFDDQNINNMKGKNLFN